jgi:hypothetical protein
MVSPGVKSLKLGVNGTEDFRQTDEGTVQDYIALTKNWTAEWLDKPATKLTVTDSFELIEEARKKGASIRRLYQIKTTVNVIFKWGMGAGKILGKDHSPFFGVDLPKKGEESEPEILNRDEFANLLERARLAEHEWYPVWKLCCPGSFVTVGVIV